MAKSKITILKDYTERDKFLLGEGRVSLSPDLLDTLSYRLCYIVPMDYTNQEMIDMYSNLSDDIDREIYLIITKNGALQCVDYVTYDEKELFRFSKPINRKEKKEDKERYLAIEVGSFHPNTKFPVSVSLVNFLVQFPHYISDARPHIGVHVNAIIQQPSAYPSINADMLKKLGKIQKYIHEGGAKTHQLASDS